MIIVMLGAQGSGKGTVGTKLSEELELVYISTGEMFREHIKNNTELGKEANEYILAGNLVPDDLTIKMLSDRVSKEDVLLKGALIDGYPRTEEQCKKLDEMLEKLDRKVDLAINLSVDYDELIRRITNRRLCKNCRVVYNIEYNPPKVEGVCDKCGGEVVQRADDTEEAVKQRLDIYYANEKAVLDYYKSKNKLRIEKAGDKIGRTSKDVAADLVKELK
ncbi:MAG: nucleoside monophosphate kinase [Clostridia bacterium]|nr:nucleoside monophosphate kinase [Clostridia bacterium]